MLFVIKNIFFINFFVCRACSQLSIDYYSINIYSDIEVFRTELMEIKWIVRVLLSTWFSNSSQYMLRSFKLCKYNPTINESPFIHTICYSMRYPFAMLLDILFWIQEYSSEQISFRRSCREGICGSCAMNINGINTLACIYRINTNYTVNTVYPLAHVPIVRDLVVSLKHFYNQYKSIQPWIHTNIYKYNRITQYQNQRNLLDGLYECILCACCSTSCPSYWWNSGSYLGPAILLQAFRWVIDSRDMYTFDRLVTLNDTFKLYRCHSILNCTQACPKSINPARAIGNLKKLIINYLSIHTGIL